MSANLNFELMARDVLGVLQKNGLFPNNFGVSLALSRQDFEAIAAEHPGHHPDVILITGTERNGVQWDIQVLWQRSPEDFPPGAVLTPPPYQQ